jgi:hypothetical protein
MPTRASTLNSEGLAGRSPGGSLKCVKFAVAYRRKQTGPAVRRGTPYAVRTRFPKPR